MSGPDDGERPRPTSVAEDAFAETVAPMPSATPVPAARPTPPASPRSRSRDQLESDETMASPASGELPPLPEVLASHYKTDGEIARGGMGKIVSAEDLRLGRKVALKQLIDPSSDQTTRFQREALITARLQHPGIVPVYEAGRWPTGEPFFAMKLVSGRPLDKVIAETTKLEERLALLPRVESACDAMAYAHSQRVIHRDLKPANVLIGNFGETVVIDWGLAKDLDAEESVDPTQARRKPRQPHPEVSSQSSTLTVAGAVMGTPAYMAPEQARGEALDQRADVFALGAMLYHVLAGTPPYNARTATDVIAAAALGKVVPLLERERRVPPELAAIVNRAMAPSPDDRYPNAGELAEELHRFLTGKLVESHRYTAMQRVMRFVRKHRAAVTIATIAVIGFAVGGTMAVTRIVEARDRAEREAELAQSRKRAAERLIDYMFTDVKTRLDAIGRLDVLASLGTEVRRYYDTLSRIPGGMPHEDEIRMAEAIDLIGQAEHRSGKTDRALETWTQSRTHVAQIVGTDTGGRTKRLRRMIAHLDFEIGQIAEERGKFSEALSEYTNAKREWDALRTEDPTARDVLLGAADTHDRLGDLLRNDGKIDEAFEQYSEAKSERELATTQGGGKVSDEAMALSTSHLKIASAYQNRGESTLALDEYRAALRLRETLAESQPDNVVVQQAVLEVEDALAELERRVGDTEAAIEAYTKALPTAEALARRDPTNADWKRQRGNMLADLGYALLDGGKFKDGIDRLGAAVDIQSALADADPQSARYQNDLSRTYTRMGDGFVDLGQTDDGIARYQRALELRRALVDRDPKSAPYRRAMAWSYAKLGGALQLKNDPVHAEAALEQALALRSDLVTEAAAQGGFRDELAASEIMLGQLIAPKDPKRSGELLTSGISRARELVEGDPINDEWKDTLVRGLIARSAVEPNRDARAMLAGEATKLAEVGLHRAPLNVQWGVLTAESHLALADCESGAAAAADRKIAFDLLQPLAKAGRLPAQRLPLLDRARAGR